MSEKSEDKPKRLSVKKQAVRAGGGGEKAGGKGEDRDKAHTHSRKKGHSHRRKEEYP